MWPDSSRQAMHKHTAVTRFTAPRGQGNALSTACCGGELPAAGGVKRGVSDYLWTLKTWVSADSIRRVIRGHSVGFCFGPPALLGNSPWGGGRIMCGLWKPGGTWSGGKIMAGD